jgi:hypothetical protein
MKIIPVDENHPYNIKEIHHKNEDHDQKIKSYSKLMKKT